MFGLFKDKRWELGARVARAQLEANRIFQAAWPMSHDDKVRPWPRVRRFIAGQERYAPAADELLEALRETFGVTAYFVDVATTIAFYEASGLKNPHAVFEYGRQFQKKGESEYFDRDSLVKGVRKTFAEADQYLTSIAPGNVGEPQLR